MVRSAFLGRLVYVVLLVLVTFTVLAPTASAGRSWCRRDPVVRIGDDVVNIYVASYQEITTAASGPTKVTITVPTGTAATLLATDEGFGYGYAVQFASSSKLKMTTASTDFSVAVVVPASANGLPVLVEVVAGATQQLASKQGVTNVSVTVKARV